MRPPNYDKEINYILRNIQNCVRRNKRHFKINQHLARHFVYYVQCLSNQKGLEFQPIVKSLYPLFVLQSTYSYCSSNSKSNCCRTYGDSW